MSKFYTNTNTLLNIYKNMSDKSEVTSQIIYGESFSIIKKMKNWVKIKVKEDNYSGHVKKSYFRRFIKPTHKVCKFKANVYSSPNGKIKNRLAFGSKIKVIKNKGSYFQFDGGWIKSADLKSVNFKNKDIFGPITNFLGTKYKWGGKTFKGIDCSALIQIFFHFNNKFCPRDTKDQINFFRKNVKLKHIKKNDIIYWKGHVAVALSSSELIHAYGPKKKVIIMNTIKTINEIKKKSKLDLKSVKNETN